MAWTRPPDPNWLEALKLADVDERVRTATEHLYQALIDAEPTR